MAIIHHYTGRTRTSVICDVDAAMRCALMPRWYLLAGWLNYYHLIFLWKRWEIYFHSMVYISLRIEYPSSVQVIARLISLSSSSEEPRVFSHHLIKSTFVIHLTHMRVIVWNWWVMMSEWVSDTEKHCLMWDDDGMELFSVTSQWKCSLETITHMKGFEKRNSIINVIAFSDNSI